MPATADFTPFFVEGAAAFGNASRVKPPLPPKLRATVNDGAQAKAPKAFPLKRWFFGSLGILVLAALVFFSLQSRDVRLRPPRLSSAVWTAQADGQPRLYFVMEEERSQRRYRGRVFWYSVT